MPAVRALEAQGGDRCLVGGGCFGGSAEVAQVILVDAALRGAHHQAGSIWREVNRRQRRLDPYVAQNAGGGEGDAYKVRQSKLLKSRNSCHETFAHVAP